MKDKDDIYRQHTRTGNRKKSKRKKQMITRRGDGV